MREPLAIVDDDPTQISPSVEDTALGREEAAALYAELAVLPEKQREAVVLRDIYGLRYDEVATALGTSRPAVEALLFRARRRLQRRLRPGLVAGVLVVPLAVQESIAYAVPGFASTAATPAAAAAVGIPLIAKLAAAGAAVGIAGSAGIVAERGLHDPPARPAGSAAVTTVSDTAEKVAPVAAPVAGAATPKQMELLPVPAGGFAAVRQADARRGRRQRGSRRFERPGRPRTATATTTMTPRKRTAATTAAPGAAALSSAGGAPANEADGRVEDDRHDNSGPGSGVDLDVPVPEPESAVPTNTDAEQQEAGNDNSGPGGGSDGGHGGPNDELDG